MHTSGVLSSIASSLISFRCHVQDFSEYVTVAIVVDRRKNYYFVVNHVTGTEDERVLPSLALLHANFLQPRLPMPNLKS